MEVSLQQLLGKPCLTGMLIALVIIVIQLSLFKSSFLQSDSYQPSKSRKEGKNQNKLAERIPEDCANWHYLTEPARLCHIPHLATGKLFETFYKATTACSAHLEARLKSERLSNKDDVKGFINFVDNATTREDCITVTLGVGGDIAAEEQILKRVPKCRMFGADPQEHVGRIYEKIGTYDLIAVGDRSGQINASVLLTGTTNYTWKLVEVTPLLNFLQKHKIADQVIDYFLLDAEGAEFGLLPYMSHGGPLDKAGVVICQLNVELHCGLPQYGMSDDKYNVMMSQFILDSDYIPIWTSKGCHNRYYFINYKSPKCIERFFSKVC